MKQTNLGLALNLKSTRKRQLLDELNLARIPTFWQTRDMNEAQILWNSLTHWQKSVLKLRHQGLTNRKIAAALDLAERTVDGPGAYDWQHKLGIWSREDLDRFMSRLEE